METIFDVEMVDVDDLKPVLKISTSPGIHKAMARLGIKGKTIKGKSHWSKEAIKEALRQ